MADESPFLIPERKEQKRSSGPRLFENLTQNHRAGLSDREGRFLYHVLKLQLKNGWQAVTKKDIFDSAAESAEPHENRHLTMPVIGQLASILQLIKWDGESRPYLIDGRAEDGGQGYATSIEGYITIPRTAKVALELQNWKRFHKGYEGQIPQADFILDFCTRFGMKKSLIERDIEYLLRHGYLFKFEFEPVHLRPNHRLQLEMEYLRRVAELFKPGTAFPQGELTQYETDVLASLWWAHNIQEKRGLTEEEIAQCLQKRGPIAEDMARCLANGSLTQEHNFPRWSGEPTVKELLEQLRDGRNMLDCDLASPTVYRVNYFVVQWPPDGQLLSELIKREANPPLRTAIARQFARKFHRSPKRIETDLIYFSETAGYIEPAKGNPGKILATRRAREHRRFLEWLGQEEIFREWKERNPEGKERWKEKARTKAIRSTRG